MEKRSVTAYPDAPDIESSTRDYAYRFRGPVGAWFLQCQADATRNLLNGTGLSVLDVGGGHGQNVDTVVDLGHSLTIFGSTDSTTEMIQQDIDNGRIRYESGSFLELPYDDNSFDVVISYRTLSHMDHWSPYVAELARVSRSTVIVDFPSSRSFNILYNPMFFIKKNIETQYPGILLLFHQHHHHVLQQKQDGPDLRAQAVFSAHGTAPVPGHAAAFGSPGKTVPHPVADQAVRFPGDRRLPQKALRVIPPQQ